MLRTESEPAEGTPHDAVVPSVWRIAADGRSFRKLGVDGYSYPSPDGRLFAVLSTRAVVLFDERGHTVRVLPMRLPRSTIALDAEWSPDGRFIAVATESDIERTLLLHADRVSAEVAASLPGEPQSFSADGKRFITAVGSGTSRRLVVSTVDGRRLSELRGVVARALSISWSSESGSFAYVRREGGIYTVGATGGTGRLLAPTRGNPADVVVRWRPGGGLIAFSTRLASSPRETSIFVVRSTGARPPRLLARCSACTLVGWRPGADEITLAGNGIWNVDVHSGRKRAVVLPVARVATPAWAPDRSAVAFAQGHWVKVVGANGAGLRVIDSGAAPRWAPDSHRLAYVGPKGVMVADKGKRRLVAPSAAAVDWSPRGDQLVVAAYRFGTRTDAEGNDSFGVVAGTLSVVRPDGTELHEIASDATVGGTLFEPRWSPDGRSIAAVLRTTTTNEGGADIDSYAIALINPFTGTLRVLAPVTGQTKIAWSPAGSSILAVGAVDSVIDVGSGVPHVVASSGYEGTAAAAWSSDGSTILYSTCSRLTFMCELWSVAANGDARHRIRRMGVDDRDVAWAA